MRSFVLSVALLIGILALALLAQQPLDNQAIIKLHNAGLTDDTILQMIAAQPGRYTTGVTEIIALKQAGVSEKIIRAIVGKANAPAGPTPKPSAGGPATIPAASPQPAASSTPPSGPAPAPAPQPPLQPTAPAPQPVVAGAPVQESAIYYANEHQWTPLPLETVTWKIGSGKFRAVVSAGTVKRDINGVINGGGSKTTLKHPAHFLLYVPQNIVLEQYCLVHMRSHDGIREFLGVKQDDFEFKATKDTVAFEGKEVESHWYRVDLPRLDPGEYGFVPPEVAAGSHAPEETGKMYTFHLAD